METHTQKFKVRLGLFVLGGLTLFVLAMFLIGKQKNLFNPVFKLTANFYNISGLQVGNNVRFSGINVGTVNNILIINDSTVRVEMMIKKEIKQFIKSNCVAAVGSEGLIGDRMLIISRGTTDAPLVREGQQIASIEPVETDAIVASLQVTAGSAEIIAMQLAEIVTKLNSGQGTLGRLIHDTLISYNLRMTMGNLNSGTQGLDELIEAAKHNILFRGYFKEKAKPAIIRDADSTGYRVPESFDIASATQSQPGTYEETGDLDTIVSSLLVTAGNAEVISQQLAEILLYINKGKGTLGRLIQDSTIAGNVEQTMMNLKSSSKSLDENMNALKGNFLFRGYFKRKAREAEKMKADSIEMEIKERKSEYIKKR
jgi:phospholipid/cholesterol/gamma-HCH transport system substrate-binding protein